MKNNYTPLSKRKKFSYEMGARFGRLVYTGVTFTKILYGHWVRYIEAVCDCGDVRNYIFGKVSCGDTQSCGCLRRDTTRKRAKTHGLSNHKLYFVYKEMIARCYDKEDKAFKNYGARNIEVWLDWRESFLCFYEWCMANGYEDGLSLDRKENDENYAPYNCRFSTVAEQNRNRRSNRYYTAFGETKCLFDWGKDSRCVVSVWGLRRRMDFGKWDGNFEGALTTPEDRKKSARSSKSAINLTAFGETKCTVDWVKDERCVVKIDSLRDRYRAGWSHEDCITVLRKKRTKK